MGVAAAADPEATAYKHSKASPSANRLFPGDAALALTKLSWNACCCYLDALFSRSPSLVEKLVTFVSHNSHCLDKQVPRQPWRETLTPPFFLNRCSRGPSSANQCAIDGVTNVDFAQIASLKYQSRHNCNDLTRVATTHDQGYRWLRAVAEFNAGGLVACALTETRSSLGSDQTRQRLLRGAAGFPWNRLA